MKRFISGLDPALLCRLAQRLRFDYECLPMYNIHRWCPPGTPGIGDGDGGGGGGEEGAFSIS